uniref:RNA-directed DNA polymerase n=1 Tax=Tanacetum cinerariifolium TaxID=118510 RepID=A0A699GQ77_TANCI|nr:DNA-directed DNA polymerase [Tanacetum cinerariifolium]
MRTRNSYFPNNSFVTIPRRRNKRRTPNIVKPKLYTIVEVAPIADNRTMDKLLQAPTEGYREAIVILEINANHFDIKTNLLQLVQANPYQCFERENPHTHINNFKRITSTLKFRDVPNDVIKLMMFSYSLEGSARVWYDKEPPNSILTWEDLTFGEAWERFKEMIRACPHHGFIELAQIDTFYNGLNDNDQDSLNAAAGGNLLSKTTREALQIIENKLKVRYLRNKPNISRMNLTSRENASKTDDRIDKLADQISTVVYIFAKKVVTHALVKAVEESYGTCGGPHAHYNCDATNSNQPSVCVATGTYNQVAPQNHASNYMAPPGFAPVQNSQNRFNQNQGQRNNFHVERETKETTDKEQTNFQESTTHIQPPVTPILEPDVPKTLPKPTIPYLLRLNDQKLRKKDTNKMEKFFQIFQDLHFDISFADALLLMLKFTSTIKSLLTKKDKLFELAKIPLNENCSAMLLKNLLEKLRDPGKFLIPCDIPGMDVCHALADLGASINRMPFSIWKKLSLPELTPTQMTLELADRSITRPKGVPEDVFVKVGKFHFPTDFLVVDFEVDPRVPFILGRSFLRTGRALIDVYEEEITLQVNDEAFTFNLNQTTRYSSTYDDLSVNRIDIINVAREEYAQEILGFSNNSSGGNPTSTSKPILSDSSLFLTPLREGDICLIEKLLNNDPVQLHLMNLKQGEVVNEKSLIKEPPKLELKDLPSHLEYAYLEGVDKLPVIIAKDLNIDEKQALLKVLNLIKGQLLRKSPTSRISNSSWVSPIHCVPKKGGITIVENENNEIIPTRLVTGWRVCIDNRKLNNATHKDHFPLPFMDQMLERLAGNEFYCFLDRFSGYFQISINPSDQENTTFTCPYGTFAYRRMPFGLCNSPRTFQRYIMAIFLDMIKKTMEVLMDEFLVFGDSFSSCLSHLDTMLQRLEVDRVKVDVIAKLPHPTIVKGVRSFLGHAGFYRRFIQDIYKIARPMTHLLEKETPFVFSKDCIDAFETLKKKLTEDLILVVPNWNLPFELMCDASDFAIGAVLGQRMTKHFQPIHYAHKTMTEAQIHYTMTEKEMLVVVYVLEKFRPYLVLSKSIVYTDHSALKYLLSKQDAKPRLIRWVLFLQEFDIIIRDKKGTENLAADHLSRLENPHKDVFENKDINENFPLETLGMSSQQKKKFFKEVNHYFWDDPYLYVRIKSFDGVCMAKKLMISSKLVMKDPPGAIMVPI